MQEEKFPYIDRLDETVLDEAILRFGTPTYVFDLEQAKKACPDIPGDHRAGGGSLLCHESQSLFGKSHGRGSQSH